MRAKLLVAIAAAFIVHGAVAENEWVLGGGVFIAHHSLELAFTSMPPPGGWCSVLGTYGIASCEDQNNRVDAQIAEAVMWMILAAWVEEDKEWCGCEFGFGEYDSRLFCFHDFGPCYPNTGLEIETPGWPGPNEGTAFIAADTPWTGNFEVVYYFGGYAYSEAGAGIILLAEDPATDFAGFSNCGSAPLSWSAASLGGLGINTDGVFACPVVPERHVCCDGIWCSVVYFEECEQIGGIWLVEYDSCELDENPCEVPEGVCCHPSGYCTILTLEACDAIGGIWFPDQQSCGPPNPCTSTPTQNASWGQLKGLYR